MLTTVNPNFYCSELAVQLDEQLFGTATRVDTWLLLSYSGSYSRKAFGEAGIPAQVKEHLNAASRSLPNSRIQLIKQGPQSTAEMVFYVAVAKELRPVLYRFDLNSYEDLLNIDVRAVAQGDPQYDNDVDEEPVYLVCTHAMHDRCCARFGLPVYKQMSSRTGMNVWQTTHLGGHRFAANAIGLPHGIMYGRLSPPDVTPLITECLGQTILLGKYRGRTCYEALEQAAEYFVRKQTLILDYMGLRHLQTERLSDTEARVTFLSTADGKQHAVLIARDIGALKTFTSCGAEHESSIDQFRLLAYQGEPTRAG